MEFIILCFPFIFINNQIIFFNRANKIHLLILFVLHSDYWLFRPIMEQNIIDCSLLPR